jgi:hypothetical protein
MNGALGATLQSETTTSSLAIAAQAYDMRTRVSAATASWRRDLHSVLVDTQAFNVETTPRPPTAAAAKTPATMNHLSLISISFLGL